MEYFICKYFPPSLILSLYIYELVLQNNDWKYIKINKLYMLKLIYFYFVHFISY